MDKNFDDHDWRDQVVPGCYFLKFDTATGDAIYGQVVLPSKQPGYLLTKAFSRNGQGLRKTHVSTMVTLLSKEQFDEARQLGWPVDEDGLGRVLFLPPN
jgi:hypothetical protein